MMTLLILIKIQLLKFNLVTQMKVITLWLIRSLSKTKESLTAYSQQKSLLLRMNNLKKMKKKSRKEMKLIQRKQRHLQSQSHLDISLYQKL